MMGEKSAEKGLNSLISEYLTSRGYLQTVATFKAESSEKARQRPGSLSSVHPEFLEAFECGERHAFFDLWHKYIPSSVQSGDPKCQHLECNMSAYFAVYPLRTGIGNRDQAMSEFRSYLDNRGSVLSQNQELAAYFALPYIPDPAKHPTFQNLFMKSWIEELRGRLVQFLEQVIPRPSSCPALLSIYLNSKKQSGALVQEDCIHKIAEVQAAYHTLCSIAMELVGALESSVAGEQISPEFIAGICSKLFENRAQPAAIASQSRPDTSTLRASILTLRQSMDMYEHGPAQNYPPLDYGKVKNVLQSSSNSTDQVALLQALRWRLTHAQPGAQRDAILSAYISNDLLGCGQEEEQDYTSTILALTRSSSPAIREQIARLFNTFSSLAKGRSYLSEAPPITRGLLDMLYEEGEEDTATRRNALGAIQKLSLRRSISRLMIKHSVVKWIVEHALGGQETLSDYTLRYSLALLMNISLRTIGRTSCAAYGPALLEALAGMLGHEEEEISEYVNGTLYSLFSSPRLQQQARQMGMGEVLEEALQRCPAQRRDQLQYILHQLNQTLPTQQGKEPDDSGDEGQEEEGDEEADPDMIEGDEEEEVPPNTIPTGETLLVKEYLSEEVRPGTRSLSSKQRNRQPSGKLPNPGLDQLHGVQQGQVVASLEGGRRTGAVGAEMGLARPVTPQSFRPRSATENRSAQSSFETTPTRRITSAKAKN